MCMVDPLVLQLYFPAPQQPISGTSDTVTLTQSLPAGAMSFT